MDACKGGRWVMTLSPRLPSLLPPLPSLAGRFLPPPDLTSVPVMVTNVSTFSSFIQKLLLFCTLYGTCCIFLYLLLVKMPIHFEFQILKVLPANGRTCNGFKQHHFYWEDASLPKHLCLGSRKDLEKHPFLLLSTSLYVHLSAGVPCLSSIQVREKNWERKATMAKRVLLPN